jgi:hypothetical protein
MDRSPRARSAVEEISPELVLVDPELARTARALLPWPELTVGAPRPRPVAVPSPPATVEEVPPTAPPAEADRFSFGFKRRLAAFAALAPALVALAVVAEFVGRSDSPRGATAPAARGTSPTKPVPPKTKKAPSHPSSAPRRTAKRGKRPRGPRFRANQVEALVSVIGKSPNAIARSFGRPTTIKRTGEYCAESWRAEGLTLTFFVRSPKNPCASGTVIGGFATLPPWRTEEGLVVGSSLAQLHRGYPNAHAVGSGWWKLGTIRLGRSSRRVPLHAHLKAGRVDRLLVN